MVYRQALFIPGWGIQGTIGQHFINKDLAYLNLPPFDNRFCSLDDLCDVLEPQIDPYHNVLIGWSFGGLVAIKLWMRRPQSYKALVLITSTPFFSQKTLWKGGILKAHQKIFQRNLRHEYDVFFQYYTKLISDPYEQHPWWYDYFVDKKDFDACKHYLSILFETDLRREFSKIKIPLLVILGENDAILLKIVHQELVTLNPNARYLMVPKASHAPFVSHQKDVLTCLSSFLQGLKDEKYS